MLRNLTLALLGAVVGVTGLVASTPAVCSVEYIEISPHTAVINTTTSPRAISISMSV